MRETPRLLDKGADDFERALLRSAARDAGSSHARARCLAAAAGASLITGAAASAASAGTATGTALLVKWVGVGVVTGLTTLGAVHGTTYAVRALSSRSTAVQPAAAARGRAAPPRAAALSENQVQEGRAAAVTVSLQRPDISSSTDTPAQATRMGSDSARNGSVAVFSDEDNTLDREVALLDAARSALSAGDARRALSLLAAQQRQFPRGALGPEARLTRIKALLSLGDRATAEAETRRLEQGRPGGAHASRARQLLEEATAKP
ncbi:MAG: hypothetical protein JW940_08940 [Polyangiaceae bacterium]|nr:hypothetical protein [Polyangiaceae bacterium]